MRGRPSCRAFGGEAFSMFGRPRAGALADPKSPRRNRRTRNLPNPGTDDRDRWTTWRSMNNINVSMKSIHFYSLIRRVKIRRYYQHDQNCCVKIQIRKSGSTDKSRIKRSTYLRI
jgi:hypothetical protein